MNPRGSAEEMAVDRPLVSDEQLEESKASLLPSSFDCNVCGRSFAYLSSLSQHMRRHTGARPYKCPYCDHRASQKGNLKVHIRSHKLELLIEPEPGDGEAEECSGEGSLSESVDSGSSPAKSGFPGNNEVPNGVVMTEERAQKQPSRGVKRERSVDASRPLRCRLCGHEVQREDQLFSHIEKAHIIADVEDDAALIATPMPPAPQEAAAATDPEGEELTCDTCGQTFAQAWLLKTHMKKHTGELEHRCKICGRGFRESWFLKSHMKTHNGTSRSSGRGRPRSNSDQYHHNHYHSEPPATINNVAQDPEVMAATGAACVYEMCSKCGHIFHSRESLRAHSRVHSKQTRHQTQHAQESEDVDSPAAKKRLLDYLCLQPTEKRENMGDEEQQEPEFVLGKRVPELDPVCSAQAWQLANRGRLGESMDQESLAAATVTYDRESSRFVLAQQDRKPSRRGSSIGSGGGTSGGGGHSSPSERSTPDDSHSDSEYRPSSRQERRRSTQSRSHECFECGKVFRSRHQLGVHERLHRRDAHGSGGDGESRSPSRPSTPQNDHPAESPITKQSSRTSTEEKPYICSLCDFITPTSSVFIAHLRQMHPEPNPAPKSPDPKSSAPKLLPTAPLSSVSKNSTKVRSSNTTATGGVGRSGGSNTTANTTPSSYPKLKRALLYGGVANPSSNASFERQPSTQPNMVTALHARPLEPSSPSTEPCEPALDLCVRAEGTRDAGPPPEDLPSHHCSYCSHRTYYPEVLWMHQMIAHRVNSSALVPKWAQKSTPSGGGKKGAEARRRTGPPPALEGKECPLLPLNVRSVRTRPPSAATSNGPGVGKQKKDRPSSSSSSSSVASSTPHSRQGSSLTSRAPPRPANRQRADQEQDQRQARTSRPRVDLYPRVGSFHGALEKSGSTGSPYSSAGGTPATTPTPTPSPSPSPGGGHGPRPALATRVADRYLLPQEGLGYMLSSKHGLSEYGRPKNTPSPATTTPTHASVRVPNKPKSSSHRQHGPSRPTSNHTHPSTTNNHNSTNNLHNSTILNHANTALTHLYGASYPHGGAAALLGLGSVGSPVLLPRSGEAKQEVGATGVPETQLDLLRLLKSCTPQELSSLYQRWGIANPLLENTGLLRSLTRQGEYVCQECGKSFSQPSHLRTHMRSHTGERPFRCHLCPYGASQKGNLKTHVQSIHHVPFDNSLHLDPAVAATNTAAAAGTDAEANVDADGSRFK